MIIKNSCVLAAYNAPDAILSVLHVLTHLFFTIL